MDFDFAIVGSGFGGSVAALRLAQKGYSVCVIERGRRFAATDFPASNWNLPRYLWLPALGWRGPQEMTPLAGLLALTGSGVGGGSLIYGGVLDEPPDSYYASAEERDDLAAHFDEARQMLGAAPAPTSDRFDDAFAGTATELGGRHHPPAVGLLTSNVPGEELADPYFGGRGPKRRSCNFCGACLTGCRYDAKNTLDKNYLHLAEQCGTRVLADTTVVSIRALGGGDGTEGYELELRGGTETRRLSARRVVVAAGTIGTNRLLLHCRDVARTLPNLSVALGTKVTNNREELLFVRARASGDSEGVAIQSLARLPNDTTILGGRFGGRASLMMAMTAPILAAGTAPGLWGLLGKLVRHPLLAVRALWPGRWVANTRLLVAMQTGAGPAGRFYVRGSRLALEAKFPAVLPAAHRYADAAAAKLDATAHPFLTNALLRLPATAHVFGGCPLGADPVHSVADNNHQAHGYHGLYVVDGSTITSNPGVAPSLLIAAMAERAMSRISAPM